MSNFAISALGPSAMSVWTAWSTDACTSGSIHELPFGHERSGASLAGVAWGAHQNCWWLLMAELLILMCNYVYVMGWSYVLYCSNRVRAIPSGPSHHPSPPSTIPPPPPPPPDQRKWSRAILVHSRPRGTEQVEAYQEPKVPWSG